MPRTRGSGSTPPCFLAGEGHVDQGFTAVDPSLTGNTATSVLVAAMYDVQQDHWADALDKIDRVPAAQRSKDLENFRDRILSRASEDRAKRLASQGNRAEAVRILTSLYTNPNIQPDERRVAVYDLYRLGERQAALQLLPPPRCRRRGGPARRQGRDRLCQIAGYRQPVPAGAGRGRSGRGERSAQYRRPRRSAVGQGAPGVARCRQADPRSRARPRLRCDGAALRSPTQRPDRARHGRADLCRRGQDRRGAPIFRQGVSAGPEQHRCGPRGGQRGRSRAQQYDQRRDLPVEGRRRQPEQPVGLLSEGAARPCPRQQWRGARRSAAGAAADGEGSGDGRRRPNRHRPARPRPELPPNSSSGTPKIQARPGGG